jgi:predicted CXXCH cytochrome family protein
LAAACWAQEFDTVIFGQNRKAFTILDQIEQPAERKAFQALLDEQEPARKRRLAELFLANYPQSWLLAAAYEMAARASIDAADNARALLYGRESLRLLPENPLLLVALANVQVHEGLLDEAARGASDALAYLERFDRPARYSRKEWEKLAPQLRSSCFYVLGRVAASRAVRAKGEESQRHWQRARQALIQSRRLNSEDPLAAYLLGLAELSLNGSGPATPHFADAARTEGPAKQMARVELRKIFESSGAADHPDFESYLASLPKSANVLSAAVPRESAAETSEPARYAGSTSCQKCHASQFSAWEKTGMARMLRAYRPENVMGDFERNNEFRAADGAVQARMLLKDGRHFFSIQGDSGRWQQYPVDYTIGSKWQQAYATRTQDGRIQVFPVQYSGLRGEWVNFWEIIDPPGSERAKIERFHELSAMTNYQTNCASCHTSQLHTETGRMAPEALTFRESGVNCEMCHGPSAAHTAAMQAGESFRKPAGAAPVDFQRLGHEDYVSICGQCHMQSAVVDPGPQGELNFSGKQRPFTKQYSRQPYQEFSKKAFYKDGRFRETTFIVESFVRSACYREGQAHCGHCHNPHPADAESNLKSLKFRDNPDQMCLQCHAGFTANIEAHTRHAASSEASRCASCHMPKIMNSLLFKAATHRIDDTPNAGMTARFGPQESPNACLLCHVEKDAAWLARELSGWSANPPPRIAVTQE